MSVATIDVNNKPNLRILLLKEHDEKGFCFFGNLNSPKFQDIRANPYVALDFHWMPLTKQVRIRGKVALLEESESDDYFASRARESQISAWASKQSEPLNDYSEFDARIKKYEEKYNGIKIPRPEFWAGYRLVPETIEFWLGKEHRRHERYKFTKSATGWDLTLLYP
jgi:pyridoxamine 5'-phosphate oxidase